MSKKSTRVGVRYDQVDAYGRVNPRLPLIDDLASFLPYHTELNVYKDGTEQLLPVNTSEPTTSPILADIRYPTGVWRNKQYFTYRKSPTEATGKARIKSIKGNTLVFNQLVNGMVTSTADGITTAYNSSTNVITITNNSRTTNYSAGSTRGNINTITITSGHKYLFCIDTVVTGVIVVHDTGSGLNDIPFNSVYTANSSTGNFRLRVTKDYDFVTAHPVNSVVSIKIMCIDLTLLNDSHITDYNSFKQYFPLPYYAYDSGSLLNFNGTGIKTTGFNLWDEEWELGQYSTINGSKTSANNTIRCKNAIYVMPNTTYYCNTAGKNMRLLYYEFDGTFIGIENDLVVNRAVTTPSNASYICFYMGSAYGTTYKDDVCINISDASKNGTYEPYTTSTLSLPISTYFPTGMKSAGDVYDELSDKAITRVGVVDLGSLTWIYDSQNTVFRGAVSDIKRQLQTDLANLLCPMYRTNTQSQVIGKNADMCISTLNWGDYVVVRNNAYTDADVFKTAMDGVMLNYELAEYVEVSTLNLGE